MRTPLLLLFVFIALFSCKKPAPVDEPKYDTLKPLQYFPVYPGSSWTYRIVEKNFQTESFEDTVFELLSVDTFYLTSTTSPEYQLHKYITYSEYPPDNTDTLLNVEYSESVYVPFFDGAPIYQYDKIDYKNKAPAPGISYMRYPFLSEEIGFEFIEGWYDGRYGYFGASYTVSENMGDTLLLIEGEYTSIPNYNTFLHHRLFYKKGVGLSLFYTYDDFYNDTVYKKELTDYYINHQ